MRRTRLHVRQSLSSREGRSAPSWDVGYWDRKRNADPDRDFRVVLSRHNQEEAEAAAVEFVKTNKQYIYG